MFDPLSTGRLNDNVQLFQGTSPTEINLDFCDGIEADSVCFGLFMGFVDNKRDGE